MSDPSASAIKNAAGDPGNTGSVMAKSLGEKIAQASGYTPGEYKAGTNNDGTWENNGRKMLKDIENGVGVGSGQGKSLIDVLGRMYKASVDWKKELKRYVADALAPETEEYLGKKKYLPSPTFPLRYGERNKYDAIEKIIVAVDTSGSMSSDMLQRIVDEITGIIFAKKVNEIVIIPFDDGIYDNLVQTVKPGAKIASIKATQGGTNFQKPLDYIKEKFKDRVNLCIFMSDGGAPPPARPKYSNKFIWIIYDDYNWKQPFGRLIKLSSKDI
jgi:predicted metal-dependent peptidase